MTDIIICGIGGKMGANILKALEDYDDVRCVGGIDAYADPSKFSVPVFKKPSDIDVDADVVVDFSRPEALQGLLDFATSRKVALLLATTGYSPEQVEAVKEASRRTAIFRSANMSLGINLLIGLARRAAAFLGDKFDVEIVETHHNKKVDSPSGTALAIADGILAEKPGYYETFGRHGNATKRDAKEIGIHAVRGGTVVGKHEVNFFGDDEVITLTHEAHSKAVFAHGAIKGAAFLKGKAPGMYDMNDLIAAMID